MRAGVVIPPKIPSSSGLSSPRCSLHGSPSGFSADRQAAQQMAVCSAAHAGTLPGRPPRVAVQLPLRPRAAAALNVTVDARVVAPGPEGCHRSQVGWALRFPENPQAICSCPRGDLSSRCRENTDGHTRASDLAIDLPHRLAGRADSIRVHPDSPAAASRITSLAALPPVHPCPLNTAAPPRRECARRALTPSLRLTERTEP